MRQVQRIIVLVLFMLISACSTSAQPTATPLPGPTGTPQSTATPRPTATATSTPYVGGECDPRTERVAMNTSMALSVSGGTYPDTCGIYCLWVPEGSSLEISISGFDSDLDLYVDTDLSVLEYGDHGLWVSNDYGNGDELVSIPDPSGRYFIQVCSYEGLQSDFTMQNTFIP